MSSTPIDDFLATVLRLSLELSTMIYWGASCYHAVMQCYASLFMLMEWRVAQLLCYLLGQNSLR